MRSSLLALAATATILLGGCGREEEPVAEKYERQAAAIQNKAQALEAQVENEVAAAEARLDTEADALLNRFAAENAGEASTGNIGEAPAETGDRR
jgi:hypothetical protein